ncbi:MAG: amidohydrolase [delta proteobacterium ML8_F1]|nr:MAG: amidohydrolase [delta proteobacterium ML8_F1]
MDAIVEKAASIQENLVNHRRTLHQMPELDLSLPRTRAYVTEQLRALGLEPVAVGEGGLSVTIGRGEIDRTVLLRADMDALPIIEETAVPFKARGDAMHACGHDLHTAMLLGAAGLLMEMAGDIPGTVKLMFQPGEETLRGARDMIENGILEGVDAAMMIHVFTGVPAPSGLFILPEAGPTTAASDWFEILIQGKGGHGAMPENTVDPLNIAAHTHISLQGLNSREIAATDPAVITIGRMAGGSTSNVIPDTALLQGTVRTFDETTRDFIEERITAIARGVATSFRGEAEVTYRRGCPSVVTDSDTLEILRDALSRHFDDTSLLDFSSLSKGGKLMGSEDFSFVTKAVPSVMLGLTAGNSEEGYAFPHHHPKTVFDESCLYLGTAAYVGFALEWMSRQ